MPSTEYVGFLPGRDLPKPVLIQNGQQEETRAFLFECISVLDICCLNYTSVAVNLYSYITVVLTAVRSSPLTPATCHRQQTAGMLDSEPNTRNFVLLLPLSGCS